MYNMLCIYQMKSSVNGHKMNMNYTNKNLQKRQINKVVV